MAILGRRELVFIGIERLMKCLISCIPCNAPLTVFCFNRVAHRDAATKNMMLITSERLQASNTTTRFPGISPKSDYTTMLQCCIPVQLTLPIASINLSSPAKVRLFIPSKNVSPCPRHCPMIYFHHSKAISLEGRQVWRMS